MYKDKDKQREANRVIQAKRRAKGVTESGCDTKGVTGSCAIDYRHNTTGQISPERTAQGNVRVSKPGDADYVPQCETTRAFVEGRDKRLSTAKRGLDIKVFEDLPPDVQQTIDRMSVVDGKIDQTTKANRTAIAIHYQHLFPDRYYSTGTA